MASHTAAEQWVDQGADSGAYSNLMKVSKGLMFSASCFKFKKSSQEGRILDCQPPMPEGGSLTSNT